MFTGIIQEIGKVTSVNKVGGGVHLTIADPHSAEQLSVNDSVSISGVCQTVIAKQGKEFVVEAVEETLRKTTLGDLKKGSAVNLELAMRLNDRLGGHLVLGHVDGVGEVVSIEEKESSQLYAVNIPGEFRRYVIPVGSIAIDGVSLTVARLNECVVTVSIIPHTTKNTTMQFLRVGSRVNIEFDLIGKYIERLMLGSQSGEPKNPLSAEKLREWGYNV